MIAPSRSPLDGGDRSRYGVNPSHSKVWLGDFPRYCPAFIASPFMMLQRGVHRYSRFCFRNRFRNGQLPYPTRNYAVRSFQRSTISSPSSSFCKLGLGRSVWYLRVLNVHWIVEPTPSREGVGNGEGWSHARSNAKRGFRIKGPSLRVTSLSSTTSCLPFHYPVHIKSSLLITLSRFPAYGYDWTNSCIATRQGSLMLFTTTIVLVLHHT